MRMCLRNIWLAWVWCIFCLPAAALAQHVPLSISTFSDGETLSVTLPNTSTAKAFLLSNPPRLVIDIQNAGQKPDIRLPKDYGGALITAVRTGQFNATTGRLVFDLTTHATMESSQQGSTLSIRLSASGKAEAVRAPEKKKPVIVIDAGHGGEDPGTAGKKGTQEKKIVLSIAREMEKALNATGKYKVVLTRTGDYFIPLRERIAYARRAKGDLFLSVHADSAPSREAAGVSVYTLSETASDKEAEALAEKENRSDIIAGIDLGDHDKDVANILISLAQRETNNQSALLADVIVGTLHDHRIHLLERSHRMAGFAVLKAPDIPSVLIETGFLSHPEEEKKLNDARYRDRLVKALASAVDRYFQKVADSE